MPATWQKIAYRADVLPDLLSPYAVGDLIYADTTTTLNKLAAVAVNNVLLSQGVSVAPSWGKVGLTTHVSGILPVANGGTGASDGWTAAHNPGHSHFALKDVTGLDLIIAADDSKVYIRNADWSNYLCIDPVTLVGGVNFSTNGNFVFQYYVGNVCIGTNSVGTGASKVFVMTGNGAVAPTTTPADVAQMWVEDVNGAAGYAGLHKMTETTAQKEVVPGVIIKTDTGSPANPYEGLIEINTFDNKIRMYGDAGWRELVIW